MTSLDLEDEKRIAGAATPGPWHAKAGDVLTVENATEIQLMFDEAEALGQEAADSYQLGIEAGRAEAGNVDITALLARIDKLRSDLFAQRGLTALYRVLSTSERPISPSNASASAPATDEPDSSPHPSDGQGVRS
jgi:hypothetical protein